MAFAALDRAPRRHPFSRDNDPERPVARGRPGIVQRGFGYSVGMGMEITDQPPPSRSILANGGDKGGRIDLEIAVWTNRDIGRFAESVDPAIVSEKQAAALVRPGFSTCRQYCRMNFA